MGPNKTSKNDITGDTIKSKVSSEKYRDNYDLIFRKDQQKDVNNTEQTDTTKVNQND